MVIISEIMEHGKLIGDSFKVCVVDRQGRIELYQAGPLAGRAVLVIPLKGSFPLSDRQTAMVREKIEHRVGGQV